MAKDGVGEILDRIKAMAMAAGLSDYQVYSDWIEAMALSIQNACVWKHDEVFEKREMKYDAIAARYGKLNTMPECMALLCLELEKDMRDVLGAIFMAGGMGSKTTGQFFTPFHVSEMLAAISAVDCDAGSREPIRLHEPSIGGGGMVIATAKVLGRLGINWQRRLRVVGQDLDWRGVYMSYVQLSLLGIDAVIVQGDTLADPFRPGFPAERVMRTPRNTGALI